MRKRIVRILLALFFTLPISLCITTREAYAQSLGDCFRSEGVAGTCEPGYAKCIEYGEQHPISADWHGNGKEPKSIPQILGDFGTQVNIDESNALAEPSVETLQIALIQQMNTLLSLVCFLCALMTAWKMKKANRYTPAWTTSILVIVASAITGYFWWS